MGHVGAGKSSLISALLGEMEKMNGHVALRVSTHSTPVKTLFDNGLLFL